MNNGSPTSDNKFPNGRGILGRSSSDPTPPKMNFQGANLKDSGSNAKSVTTINNPEKEIKVGKLLKKPSANKLKFWEPGLWRELTFKLQYPELRYYYESTDKKHHGKIVLRGVKISDFDGHEFAFSLSNEGITEQTSPTNPSSKHPFLQHKKKTWILAARSEEEKNQWKESIKRISEYHPSKSIIQDANKSKKVEDLMNYATKSEYNRPHSSSNANPLYVPPSNTSSPPSSSPSSPPSTSTHTSTHTSTLSPNSSLNSTEMPSPVLRNQIGVNSPMISRMKPQSRTFPSSPLPPRLRVDNKKILLTESTENNSISNYEIYKQQQKEFQSQKPSIPTRTTSTSSSTSTSSVSSTSSLPQNHSSVSSMEKLSDLSSPKNRNGIRIENDHMAEGRKVDSMDETQLSLALRRQRRHVTMPVGSTINLGNQSNQPVIDEKAPSVVQNIQKSLYQNKLNGSSSTQSYGKSNHNSIDSNRSSGSLGSGSETGSVVIHENLKTSDSV